MALADKEKALWGIKENEAGRLPTLSLSSGYSLSPSFSPNQGSSTSDFGSSSTNDNFNNSLKVNWPLYTGGRVEGQIDQAKLNADIANLGVTKAQQQLKLDKTGIKIADSAKLPTINFSASDGLNGSDFPGQNNNWAVGVAASWNIFDAGVTNSKVKEAKANEDKVIAGDKQTRDAIELEVRQAYLSMKEAEARMSTSQVAVSQGVEGLKAIEAKYYAGAGTNMDVIDAQMALTQANTNATQATCDYNVNKAKLEKAKGL